MKIVSVTEEVLYYLRARIITGELKPEQRLNEVELSSKLGISRPPLREAFRLLQKEHLIHSIPRKGTCVTSISKQDFLEVFQVREMIEGFAIQLLEFNKVKDISRMASTLGDTTYRNPPPESDPEARYEYLRAIADFHIKLVECTGNSRLSSFYHVLMPSLARYQSLYTYNAELMEQSHADHKKVLNMIEGGDYNQATNVIKSHIRNFVDVAIDKLDDRKAGTYYVSCFDIPMWLPQ